MVRRLAACSVAMIFLTVACGGAVTQVEDDKGSPATSPSRTSPAPPAPTAPTPSGVVPIVATSYDQTCSTDTDCVAITEIADCSCACPTAAINKSALPQEQRDVEAHSAACEQLDPGHGCGVDCIANHVFCDISEAAGGTCRLVYP